jgi:hypothetical protein
MLKQKVLSSLAPRVLAYVTRYVTSYSPPPHIAYLLPRKTLHTYRQGLISDKIHSSVFLSTKRT